jgi:hypothetical protein
MTKTESKAASAAVKDILVSNPEGLHEMFRTVPRLVIVGRLCSRSMNAQFVLVGFLGPKGAWKRECTGEDDYRLARRH